MHRYAYRGAAIGGFISLALHLLARFIVCNSAWIIIGIALLAILGWCSPRSPVIDAKRTVLKSFNRSRVIVSNVGGLALGNSPRSYVEAVSANVTNNANARIFDLWLRCNFSERSSTDKNRFRVNSDYHYGYLSPGTAAAIRLRLNDDAALNNADPESFICEPEYELETSDLFRGQP